ncbi:MAG: NAD(P)-dependent oxidoreductase [Mycoplasmatales bacterium]
MKIAVVCANGKAGRLIVKEAQERGLDVTAITRKPNETVTDKTIQKDLFDLTKEDLQEFDVVVDAFGTFKEETLPMHSTSLMHLCDSLSGTKTRLIIVGGAGSLYVNEEHTATVADSPDFPKEVKPLALAMGKGLKELRERKDVMWTYVSPAINFQAEGSKTGTYKIGGEEVITNTQGESIISYADYAIAIIDEAINKNYIQKRINVIAE